MEVLLARFRKPKTVVGVLPFASGWLMSCPIPGGEIVLQSCADDLSDTLQRTLAHLCVRQTSAAIPVVTALAQHQVLCHWATISDRLSLRDSEALAYYQAEQYFANAADNLALDAVLLGTSLRSSAKQDILLIAAHKQQVNDTQHAYADYGLRLIGLDIYAVAIARYLQHQQDKLPTQCREGSTALLVRDINDRICLYCFWRLMPVAYYEYVPGVQALQDFITAKLQQVFAGSLVGLWLSLEEKHAEDIAIAHTIPATLPKVMMADSMQAISPRVEHMVAYGCALYQGR